MLSGILDQLEKKSSRWKRTKATVNEMMLEENMLSCEALDRYYAIHFEENKSDKNYLETAIALYKVSACKQSDIYIAASENFYSLDPNPVSAHNLGILFISMGDNKKAVDYLEEAVQYRKAMLADPSLEEETRQKLNYSLGQLPNSEDVFFRELREGH